MTDKHPSPRADALREMREARYGHLQATAEARKPVTQPPKLAQDANLVLGSADTQTRPSPKAGTKAVPKRKPKKRRK